MKFDFYEKAISKTLTSSIRDLNKERLTYIALGLFEECGEITSEFRKNSLRGNYHEKDLDLEHIQEEIGDCIWYLSFLSKDCGKTLNQIAVENIRKVYLRHDCPFLDNEINNLSDFTIYQELSSKSIKEEIRNCNVTRLVTASLGLNKEIGRISDEVGEYVINGNVLRKDKITEKIGDSLWYCTLICNTLDFDLSKIAEININKTKKRYDKDGNSKADSINR